MDNSSSQPLQQVQVLGRNRLVRKLRGLLDDGDISTSCLDIFITKNDESVDIVRMAAACIDQRNYANKTPLHLSAEIGDIELVELFLTAGAKVNAKDSDRRTPLHVSSDNGDTEIVEILLTAGANVDAKDNHNKTPLHLSACHGHKEIVEVLIIAGAKVDVQDSKRQTPLYLSIYRDHVKVSKVLLRFGASVNKNTILGHNVLSHMTNPIKAILGLRQMKNSLSKPHHQVHVLDNGNLVRRLYKLLQDEQIRDPDDYKLTDLHHKIFTNKKSATPGTDTDYCENKSSLDSSVTKNDESVDILLIAVAYANQRNGSNKTPLHLCAEIGDTELAELFLRAGAKINSHNWFMQTPLHLSAQNSYKEIVKILLLAGADVDPQCQFMQTPLHVSAEIGDKEIVELLLKAGAKVHAKNSECQTPLHLSAFRGHTEIVKILLTAEAIVDAEDSDKQTPLHLSANNGHKEIVEILLRTGAKVNAEDCIKQTPLHQSAVKGHKDIVEVLLNAGAEVDAEDCGKLTPLDWSIRGNHIEVAEVLFRFGASVNKRNIYGDSVLECMTERQRTILRPKFPPTIVRTSVSTTTEVKHTETVSATFTASESGITTSDDSSGNKAGQGHVSSDNPARVTSEPGLRESATTSSGSAMSGASSTPGESRDLCNPGVQELGNIRQVEDHLAKLSLVHKEGCVASCSSDVKTTLPAGRIFIPTTINIIKMTKTIINGPITKNNVDHANLVPTNCSVVLHQTTRSHTVNDCHDDGDDDDDDDGSNIVS